MVSVTAATDAATREPAGTLEPSLCFARTGNGSPVVSLSRLSVTTGSSLRSVSRCVSGDPAQPASCHIRRTPSRPPIDMATSSRISATRVFLRTPRGYAAGDLARARLEVATELRDVTFELVEALHLPDTDGDARVLRLRLERRVEVRGVEDDRLVLAL